MAGDRAPCRAVRRRRIAAPAPATSSASSCRRGRPCRGRRSIVSLQSSDPVTLTAGASAARPYRSTALGRTAAPPVPGRSSRFRPLQLPGYVPLIVRAGDQKRSRVNVPVRAGAFESINIPAATAGPILSETGEGARRDGSHDEALRRRSRPAAWTPRSRFRPPLHGEFRHTSPFGSRRTYGKDPALSAHAGEDYSALAGTPVYAPAEGTVVLAEQLFVRGNAVVLDHGNGVFTGYWHLSELDVKPGEVVAPGQLLGKVGSTGLSTGAHLHWEMRVSGMAVDPLQWLGQETAWNAKSEPRATGPPPRSQQKAGAGRERPDAGQIRQAEVGNDLTRRFLFLLALLDHFHLVRRRGLFGRFLDRRRTGQRDREEHLLAVGQHLDASRARAAA